jgi:hypothetical protein
MGRFGHARRIAVGLGLAAALAVGSVSAQSPTPDPIPPSPTVGPLPTVAPLPTPDPNMPLPTPPPTVGPGDPNLPPTLVPGMPPPTLSPGDPGLPTHVPGMPSPTIGPGVPPATFAPGVPNLPLPTFAPGDPNASPTFAPGVPNLPPPTFMPGDPNVPVPPKLTETPRTPVPVLTFVATPPPVAPPLFTFDPTLFGPAPLPPTFVPLPFPTLNPGDSGAPPPFIPLPTFAALPTFAPPPTPVATITLGDFGAGSGIRLALPPAMFGADQGTIGIVPAELPTFTFDPNPAPAAPGEPPAVARPPVVVGAFTLTLTRQRAATPVPAPPEPGAPPTPEPTAAPAVDQPIQIVQRFTPPEGFRGHRSLSFFRRRTTSDLARARSAQQTSVQWERIPTTVDTATNTAVANTNLAGEYVLMDQALVPQSSYAVFVPSVQPGTLLSSITLRNSGSTAATARLRFTRADGAIPLASDPSYTVPANGTTLVYLPAIADLPAGDFALRVDSTAPISAVANHSRSANSASTGYAAIPESSVDLQLYFPQVYKSYFGFNSNVVLQNTGSAAATVSVSYLGSNGFQLATETRSIPAGAAATLDQSTNSALNAGFAGSAIVTSTQRLAGVANVSGSNGTLLSSAVGIGSGAQQAYVPSLYKGYYGFDSSLLIQNTDSVEAAVEVTYSTGLRKSMSVPVGASTLVFQPNEPDLPAGWQGSAIVRATNGARILAVGNVQNGGSGRLSAYNAPTDGSPDVVLPALYNGYSAASWASSLTVQNVDTAATTIEIVYGDGWIQRIAGLAAGASQLVFQPSVSGLTPGWQGSATVRSIEGRRIIVVVNEEAQSTSLGQADWLISYVGFAQ